MTFGITNDGDPTLPPRAPDEDDDAVMRCVIDKSPCALVPVACTCVNCSAWRRG